ncbi:MAG: biotin/lipoyl-containing protein, partial [Alcaligenaceae bacterium]
MSKLIDISIPDIGDFDTVDVIELLVAVGDTIKAEQSLITVESDKSSMEIPSNQSGVVKTVLVKIGDKVKQGTVIVQLEASAGVAAVAASSAPTPGVAPAAPSAPVPASRAATAPVVASYAGKVDAKFDLLVLGAGPGGYSAAFRAADLGLNVVLVERYSTLGGVCLNVGCIPSKALLHTAAVLEEAQALADHGISFSAPKIDLDKLRAFKDGVIGKLTGGLAGMAKARKVTVVTGEGAFVSANHVSVQTSTGV